MKQLWRIFVFILLFYISGSIHAQSIPPEIATPICDNTSISTGAPGNSGYYNIMIPCSSSPLSAYLDFYRVVIQSGTTFTFIVEPIGMDDYDFGAWKNPNWDNLNATSNIDKRGSQNDPFQSWQFNLGLSLTATDLCETPGSAGFPEPGMVRYFDVEPGDEILIIIDRWSQTSDGYSMDFGGDAVLDCTILGNSYGKCDVDENNSVQYDTPDFLPDLQDQFPNHVYKYYNTQAAAEADTGNQVNFPINVNYNDGEPTELFVRIETDSGVLVRILKMFFFVNLPPQLLTASLELPEECDINGHDQAVFDLTQSESSFVNDSGEYGFKYYAALADAEAGNNNFIPNPQNYLSGQATIYVRIETGPLDGNEEGCFAIGEVKLMLGTDPDITELPAQEFCSPQPDGTVPYDLTQFENQWITNPQSFNFKYYTSQQDADNQQNPITNPEAYPLPIGNTTNIYVRVTDIGSTCSSQTVLVLKPEPTPELTLGVSINVCDDNFDGIFHYNLHLVGQLMSEDFNQLTFDYYRIEQDAINEVNPVPVAEWTDYEITELPHILWVRAAKNNDCSSIPVPIKFIPGTDISLLTAQNEAYLCEGDSANLMDYISVYTTETNVAFNYYYSIEDAQEQNNPIENLTEFDPGTGTVLYIRLDKNDRCSVIVILKLTVNPNPEVMDLPEEIFCSVEEEGTVMDYNLTQHEFEWINNPQNYNFQYFTTLEDAENGINSIPDPTAYPVTVGGSTTVYVRVAGAQSGCFTVTEFVISPRQAIHLNQGIEIEICDDDLDGVFEYNLLQLNPLLAAGFNELNFVYYTNQQDANNQINPIPQNQWTNYQFTSTPHNIWVVGSTADNCPSPAVMVRFVPADKIPVQAELKEESVCEGNIIDLTEYIPEFTNDPEISFDFYNTLSDAQQQTNPIVNLEEYYSWESTVLYIRLEKPESCPIIVRLQLTVRTGPEILLSQNYVKFCPGDFVEINASSPESGVEFYWSLDGEILGEGQNFIIEDIGNYVVTATDAEGCSNQETVTVVPSDSPVITGVEAGKDYLIIEAVAGGGGGYMEYSIDGVFWQDSPRFDYLTAGNTYTVYVRQDGCFMDKYEVTLPLIPNVLTPNDDGLNDIWAVRGISAGMSATLKIFDRYGKIFVDTWFDDNYYWAGKYMGDNVPSGDYWYIIEIPSDSADTKNLKFTGHVTVKNQ